MTVASTTNRKTFAGDSATTSFGTSPVVFFETSDLVVSVVTDATGASTTLTENTHYTTSGGSGSTGTVSLAGGTSPHGALLTGTTLVILRVLPFTQGDDFVNNDINDAEVLEDRLDKITMMIQQLDEVDDRTLRLSSSETATTALTELPFDRASKFLAFNASKELIASAGTTGTSTSPVSAFMDTVLDDTTAANARTTLGVGSTDSPTFAGINPTGAGTSTPVEGLTQSNVAVGISALAANTTGSENTAVGVHALLVNTTGTENIAVGALALAANTTAQENVAVGVRALGANTTGNQNTAIGHAALNDCTTGSENVAIGQTALYNSTTASQNTAVGRQALETLVTGNQNVAVGMGALNTSNGADNNTAVGRFALFAATTGSNNAVVGSAAGNDVTTGAANTLLGYNTGRGITTGSNNTVIGAQVTGLAAGLTGNIIIADGNGSAKAQFDATRWTFTGGGLFNTSTYRNGIIGVDHNGAAAYGMAVHNTDTGSGGQYAIYFTRGAGVTEVGSIVTTNVATTFNTSSDYRLKDRIQDLTGSGAFIDALRPRKWEWKIDGSIGAGFIAHEAQAVTPSSVVGEKDGTRTIRATGFKAAIRRLLGKPVDTVVPHYQGMDVSSPEIIANLVAEVQALRKRVAKLEKRRPT